MCEGMPDFLLYRGVEKKGNANGCPGRCCTGLPTLDQPLPEQLDVCENGSYPKWQFEREHDNNPLELRAPYCQINLNWPMDIVLRFGNYGSIWFIFTRSAQVP